MELVQAILAAFDKPTHVIGTRFAMLGHTLQSIRTCTPSEQLELAASIFMSFPAHW